jgi:tRNA(fMet)-specific endonuclease VapC
MSRKGLESAASHGIPPPGIDPRFKRNHRSRTKAADRRAVAHVCGAGLRRIEVAISAVTLAELVHRVARANTPEIRIARRAFIDELKKHVPVHPVTDSTAEIAGQISGEQAAKGVTLPADDLLIGASAIEQGYAVATPNIRHFEEIPGLRVLPL